MANNRWLPGRLGSFLDFCLGADSGSVLIGGPVTAAHLKILNKVMDVTQLQLNLSLNVKGRNVRCLPSSSVSL